MLEPFTPAEKLWSFLGPWSEEDGTFLTPTVWLEAHVQTEKMVFIERLVGTVPGQNDYSEALDKLCRLADVAHCSLVLLTTPAEESWYGSYGFRWYRNQSKDVWVRRPQAHTS